MPDLRAELAAAGEAYKAAERARDEALERIGEIMRRADGEVSVVEMSKLGQVSRVTAYRLLGRS